MAGFQMIDKDKQLVEQWWINLYDSIEPAKKKINYQKEYQKECQKSPKYKEYQKEYQKEYRKSPKYKEYHKEYYQKNRTKILDRLKNKHKEVSDNSSHN